MIMFENIFGNKKCKINVSDEPVDTLTQNLLGHYINKINCLIDDYRNVLYLFYRCDEKDKTEMYKSEIIRILNEFDDLIDKIDVGLFYRFVSKDNVCIIKYLRSTSFIYLKDFTRHTREAINLYINGSLSDENVTRCGFLSGRSSDDLDQFIASFYRECMTNIRAYGSELSDVKTRKDLQNITGNSFKLITFPKNEDEKKVV